MLIVKLHNDAHITKYILLFGTGHLTICVASLQRENHFIEINTIYSFWQ